MSNILDRIVSATRRDLAELSGDPAREASEAARVVAGRKARRLEEALRSGQSPRVIAEIKAGSPSAGTIIESPDVEQIARDYERGGAAAISIVTERHFFRGDPEWLRRAADSCSLPLLMKDFIVSPRQIHRAVISGADAVLLLASLHEAVVLRELRAVAEGLGCDVLVEAHDERELERALSSGATIVGINSRDLRDFSVDIERAERLSSEIPAEVVRVAESGIHGRSDIERLMRAGFDAFLVGESLLRSADRAAAVAALCVDGGAALQEATA